jgi:uracil-DNA glycosylase
MTAMTIDAEHAARNQNTLVLVLGITAARALVRNRIVVVLGLIAATHVARRRGAAMSAALRRRAGTNLTAWRHS